MTAGAFCRLALLLFALLFKGARFQKPLSTPTVANQSFIGFQPTNIWKVVQSFTNERWAQEFIKFLTPIHRWARGVAKGWLPPAQKIFFSKSDPPLTLKMTPTPSEMAFDPQYLDFQLFKRAWGLFSLEKKFKKKKSGNIVNFRAGSTSESLRHPNYWA